MGNEFTTRYQLFII